ncbi:putative serine/threonine-protein kinase-like protein CCR3 [Hevea brasiliensis]|uniref:putative serine/threonine-protein kinase-like protein CCR3 n=1 Tax=Hevea brasiliensis TaxID=3981 RepID=UPI0025F3AF1C|nr:putative serine/threonine-protein kinase-like protein CCR3 [Hevea brasiliensis]
MNMVESLHIDVKQDDEDDDDNGSEKADRFDQKVSKLERIFLIANFILKLTSAAFDQLSSVQKPQYALLSMIISFTVLIISIIDLLHKGRNEKVSWMRRRLIPWFYYPYPNPKPFGTFPDIIGLVCAVFQCIFAAISYAFLCQHADTPIKVSVLPIIFAFGLLSSRLSGNNTEKRPTPHRRRLNGAEGFTLAQIAAATYDFSPQNKVGVGRSFAVYRGRLPDGSEVAVKRGDTNHQRKKFQEEDRFFETELTFLSRLHHKHLVRLVGYCEEENEKILVYEYAKYGSLHDFLHKNNIEENSSVINSWKMRIQIALDAARGIEYLHNYAVPPIIHGDIKSSNILLDANWAARVCDFRLSLLGAESESNYKPKKAVGTVGYVDPEFYSRNVITAKSDVYSFGVVLLELLTGKRAIFNDEDSGDAITSIVDFTVPKILANELLKVLDERIAPPELLKEAEALELVAYTALHCVNLEGNNRPSITNIVSNLDQALSLCDVPMEVYQHREGAEESHGRSHDMEPNSNGTEKHHSVIS